MARTQYTKEAKPGGSVELTWDEATQSWQDIEGTWDQTGSAATPYTKETKPEDD